MMNYLSIFIITAILQLNLCFAYDNDSLRNDLKPIIYANLFDSNSTFLAEIITYTTMSSQIETKDLGEVSYYKESKYTIHMKDWSLWHNIFKKNIKSIYKSELKGLCGCQTNGYYIIVKRTGRYTDRFKFQFGYCADTFGKGHFKYKGEDFYLILDKIGENKSESFFIKNLQNSLCPNEKGCEE